MSTASKPWLPTAVAVALSHLALLLGIQLESYFVHVFAAADGGWAIARFLALFPFAQLEHLLVSALFGAIYAVIASKLREGRVKTACRWVLLALLLAVNLYVVVDQVVYGFFHGHVDRSLHEGKFPAIDQVVSVFLSATGPLFFVNVGLWLALGVLQHRLVVRDLRPVLPWIDRKGLGARAAAAAFLAVSAGVTFALPHHELERHPLVALVRPTGAWKSNVNGGRLSPSLYEPRSPRPEEPADAKARLVAAYRAMREAHARPNIVLVVLESVGSEQLFRDAGRLSPESTPFLYEMQPSSVHLPYVYAAHPATILSHVPMQTGGFGITWGSVFTDLEKPYRAATLPSVFKGAGYKTGLISSGDLLDGNMGAFYRQLPWDHYWDFGIQTDDVKKSLRLGSWGGRDDLIAPELDRWLDGLDANAPFYAALLTISTHYPYVVPPGYEGPRKGKSDAEKYDNSIHYADGVLRALWSGLERRGKLDDTVVFITGDHGQAFGDLHRGNFAHRNRIYEENVRTFLIAIDKKAIDNGPVVSERIGATADILPTIAETAGLRATDVVGQNLLSADYRPRIAYFFKSNYPEQWGLRDGNWKFIARTGKEAVEPELYDLETDPTEQKNLAGEHPELVPTYQALCSEWYFGMQAELGQRLVGYRPISGKELAPGETMTRGPKAVDVFTKDKKNVFHTLEKVPSFEKVNVRIVWVPFGVEKTVRVDVISPSGRTYSKTLRPAADTARNWFPLDAPLPLEEGRWTMALWDGTKRLKSGGFEVVAPDATASRAVPGFSPGPRLVVMGKEDDAGNFTVLRAVHPSETALQALTVWSPYTESHDVRVEWTSPSGKKYGSSLRLEPARDRTSSPLPVPPPLEAGTWQLTMSDDSGPLVSHAFQVDPGAPR